MINYEVNAERVIDNLRSQLSSAHYRIAVLEAMLEELRDEMSDENCLCVYDENRKDYP